MEMLQMFTMNQFDELLQMGTEKRLMCYFQFISDQYVAIQKWKTGDGFLCYSFAFHLNGI